ncbi:MAG: VOC family protein [Chloroflexota bacterium]
MTLSFDHVIIAVDNLTIAIEDYKSQGFTVIEGGEHGAGTTHNALICFKDGSYIELIALTGATVPEPDVAIDFAPLIRRKRGVVGYAFRSDDLKADTEAMQARGVPAGDIQQGMRHRKDGIALRWQILIPENDPLMLFIEDETPRHLRVPNDEHHVSHSNGATGVRRIVHVQAEPQPFVDKLHNLTGIQPEPSANGFSLKLDPVAINIMRPGTDLLRSYHETNGDSVWRLVLGGIGEMYRHLDHARLRGADIVIAGDGAM